MASIHLTAARLYGIRSYNIGTPYPARYLMMGRGRMSYLFTGLMVWIKPSNSMPVGRTRSALTQPMLGRQRSTSNHAYV